MSHPIESKGIEIWSQVIKLNWKTELIIQAKVMEDITLPYIPFEKNEVWLIW